MSVNGNTRTPTPKVSGKTNYINLKLTLRLLPPNLTKEQFIEQLDSHTTLSKDGSIVDSYYVQGCYPSKPFEKPTYSRAYLLFNNQLTLDQFMRDLSGKSFIEPETNDSLKPAIGKSLYNKMPPSKPNTNSVTSKKYEDDEFYKEFLSLLESNKADTFDLALISKKLKKKSRDKKKKDKEPKKKEDKKGKLKEENKRLAKTKQNKTTKATEESGETTKVLKSKSRNKKKKTEGENVKEKAKPKTSTKKDPATKAPSKQNSKQQDNSKTKNPEKSKQKSEAKSKAKQSQEAGQKQNQDSSSGHKDDKVKPKIKIKQKLKDVGTKPEIKPKAATPGAPS